MRTSINEGNSIPTLEEGNDAEGNQEHVRLFDDSKAGLQGVDKKKTEQIIEEMSKGSSFYSNEERKLKNRQARVNALLQKEENVFKPIVLKDDNRYQKIKRYVDEIEAELERNRGIYIPDTVEDIIKKWQQNPNDSNILKYIEEILRHTKIYVHVDMDMFYAACEEKKNPKLKGVPFAVGNSAMLSTSNYLSRQFGVRSGMPGFIAKRICPQLQLVDLDFDTYKKESAVFKKVCERYDPNYISFGLDEITLEISSYLKSSFHHLYSLSFPPRAHKFPVDNDLSSTQADEEEKGQSSVRGENPFSALFQKTEEIVQQLRHEIYEETQLTASAGIALTATLSKIGSNYNKPNGQRSLLYEACTKDKIIHFFEGLNVKEVPGVGKSTEYILNRLGVFKWKDFYDQRYRLGFLLTQKTFKFLFGSAIGICSFMSGFPTEEGVEAKGEVLENRKGKNTPNIKNLVCETDRKSIGQERTFYQLKSRLELQEIMEANFQNVCERLVSKRLLCGQIVIKIKYTSFAVKQFSKDIELLPCDVQGSYYHYYNEKYYTDNPTLLKANLDALFIPLLDRYAEYRLLGLRVDKLINKDPLLEFEKKEQGNRNNIAHQRSLISFFSSKGKNELMNNSTNSNPEAPFQEVIILSSDSHSSNSGDDDSNRPSIKIVMNENPLDTSDGRTAVSNSKKISHNKTTRSSHNSLEKTEAVKKIKYINVD